MKTTDYFRLTEIGFWLVIVSYALIVFSSPMPLKVGSLEVFMGAGLTIGAVLLALPLFAQRRGELKSLFLCVLYLTLLPLLVGILRGNSISNIMRDVAPVLFLLVLPAVFSSLPKSRHRFDYSQVLVAAVLAVGVISAFQYYYGMSKGYGSFGTFVSIRSAPYDVAPVAEQIEANAPHTGGSDPNASQAPQVDLMRVDLVRNAWMKIYDPVVLFSGIFLLCIGIQKLLIKPQHYLSGMAAICLGVFCSVSYGSFGLRAYVGLSALAVFLFIYYLIRFKLRDFSIWRILAILGIVALIASPYLNSIITILLEKQKAVGGNGKLLEFVGVWKAISVSWPDLLFGIGWGGEFMNPIFSASTRFTHSVITFWLLKTGVVGFGVFSFFIWALVRRSSVPEILNSPRRLAITLGALSAIITGVLFQPSYKMLSYSFIICVLLMEFSPLSGPSSERELFRKQ